MGLGYRAYRQTDTVCTFVVVNCQVKLRSCFGEHPWVCMMKLSGFTGSILFIKVSDFIVIQSHCTQEGMIVETL